MRHYQLIGLGSLWAIVVLAGPLRAQNLPPGLTADELYKGRKTVEAFLDAQPEAQELLRRVRARESKEKLATLLLGYAKKETKPSIKFQFLELSLGYARDSGSLATLYENRAFYSQSFKLKPENEAELLVAGLESVRVAGDDDEVQAGIKAYLKFAAQLVARSDGPRAGRLMNALLTPARRLDNRDLRTRVVESRKRVQELKESLEQHKRLIDQIKNNKNPAKTKSLNQALGELLCLQLGRWNQGLEILKDADGTLSDLAKQDRRFANKSPSVDELKSLASGWAAQKATYLQGKTFAPRAYYWLTKARELAQSPTIQGNIDAQLKALGGPNETRSLVERALISLDPGMTSTERDRLIASADTIKTTTTPDTTVPSTQEKLEGTPLFASKENVVCTSAEHLKSLSISDGVFDYKPSSALRQSAQAYDKTVELPKKFRLVFEFYGHSAARGIDVLWDSQRQESLLFLPWSTVAGTIFHRSKDNIIKKFPPASKDTIKVIKPNQWNKVELTISTSKKSFEVVVNGTSINKGTFDFEPTGRRVKLDLNLARSNNLKLRNMRVIKLDDDLGQQIFTNMESLDVSASFKKGIDFDNGWMRYNLNNVSGRGSTYLKVKDVDCSKGFTLECLVKPKFVGTAQIIFGYHHPTGAVYTVRLRKPFFGTINHRNRKKGVTSQYNISNPDALSKFEEDRWYALKLDVQPNDKVANFKVYLDGKLLSQGEFKEGLVGKQIGLTLLSHNKGKKNIFEIKDCFIKPN